jgi:hypothetical protein
MRERGMERGFVAESQNIHDGRGWRGAVSSSMHFWRLEWSRFACRFVIEELA